MLTDSPLKIQTFPERINNFIFFDIYEFSEFGFFYKDRINLSVFIAIIECQSFQRHDEL